ncbi:acid sphingomyelinase-like phosphodiesterase 3a [Protopterus annectens]|uniref:acid sphingomyelinase-like phosphodiesterase 3a n=1 Tax=Protopterus annectens TaxID=7888 RepID=UPI001CFAF81A|nr:acid sphingomyelinase-like phosphodiesterase 3a [Protopterus annectens]
MMALHSDSATWIRIATLVYTTTYINFNYLLVSAGPYVSRDTGGARQFWHVTDLHLDPSFHLTDDPRKVCFSSKGSPALNPGPYGDFLCDAPYLLIRSAFEYMKQIDQHPSFMLWTGDSPPHVPVKELSTDVVINVIRNMTLTIREFFPELQVFPALGNHDYWPQDQLPVSTSEVYNAVADMWKCWLTDDALATLRKGGFYTQIWNSTVTQQVLRIVSLNTNLYYSPNKETLNVTDPAQQFEWFEGVLKSARQHKEQVYVIAHVPVGYLAFARYTPAMRAHFNERLVKILRTYSDIIAGQFFGHTHRDSLMILHDEKGNPVNSLFVAPAVTPIRNAMETESNNPGVRLFKYNEDDYNLLDIWQYFLNLTEANEEKKPDWKLEYVMTTEYGIKDLQPSSLHQLAKQFTESQSKQFSKYYTNYIVSYNDTFTCTGDCKLNQVCAIQYLDVVSYVNCILHGGL